MDVSRVAVVTDSTACIGAVLAGADLRTVEVMVLFTDREAADCDVDPGEVYERLARGEAVKSQAPAAAAYLQAIEEGDHDGVLVLTPADEFTVMAHNARLAAELAARPTVVVDTRTAAAGHGLVVRAAISASRAGAGLEHVSDVARAAAGRVELVAAMYEPSYLEHSGHIHAPAEVMIARFRDGQVVPLAATGDPLRSLATSWRKGRGTPDTTLVFHSALGERAEELRRTLRVDEPVLACGAAMGSHVGPGLVGVAWLR
jgi:DegV family protein with EDD domain